jgi:predicted permease
VNAFEVLGPILILWALLVAFLGITRENFPGSQTAERVVGAISVLLVMLAIGAAIYTSSHEHKKGKAALPSLPA